MGSGERFCLARGVYRKGGGSLGVDSLECSGLSGLDSNQF